MEWDGRVACGEEEEKRKGEAEVRSENRLKNFLVVVF